MLIQALDKSTYFATVSFFDEAGDAVIPLSAKWTLTDGYCTVVNNRDQVDIGSLAASVDIVMSGDDLSAIGHPIADKRHLIIEATYQHLTEGILPINMGESFLIQDIPCLQQS